MKIAVVGAGAIGGYVGVKLALAGSVVELGRLTQTPTPHIDTVYALVKLLARTMDEQRGRVKMQPTD